MKEFGRGYDPSKLLSSIQAGHVYLIYSGDEDFPYAFVKVLQYDTRTVLIKCWLEKFATPPPTFDQNTLMEGVATIRITIDHFLAWGPPEPVLYALQTVSDEELLSEGSV